MSARKAPRTTPHHLPAAQRASARGYTVVEVMLAITALVLGSMAVIALQKVTVYGNMNARNLATANAVAQAWMERLRADSLAWNEPNGISDLATDTKWLQGASTTPVGEANWTSPALVAWGAAGTPAGSPAADVMGADIFSGDTLALNGVSVTPATAFCTQIRLTRFCNTSLLTLASATTANLGGYYRLIRAEVRVIWARNAQALDCANLPADFDQPSQMGTYGIVYLVSAVSENQAPSY